MLDCPTNRGIQLKLSVRNAFPCSVDEFWAMYWDPQFDEVLQKEARVTRKLLHEETKGDVTTRRVKLTPDADLPAAVAAILGSKKLEYEQENRWDAKARVLHWRVIPTVLPGKLDAAGTMTVRPTSTGCEQVVDGSIVVKVMLVGGKIEQAVVDEVSRSYDRAAAACRRWLAEKK